MDNREGDSDSEKHYGPGCGCTTLCIDGDPEQTHLFRMEAELTRLAGHTVRSGFRLFPLPSDFLCAQCQLDMLRLDPSHGLSEDELREWGARLQLAARTTRSLNLLTVAYSNPAALQSASQSIRESRNPPGCKVST